MASQPLPSTSSPPPVADGPLSYWCYHCDKRVSVDPLPNQPDLVCRECRNGFVELISFPLSPAIDASGDGNIPDPATNHQFLQILRLFAHAARVDRVPRSSTSPRESLSVATSSGGGDESPWYGILESDSFQPPENDDFLRIELDDGWVEANLEGDEEDEEADQEEEEEAAQEDEDQRTPIRDSVRVRIRERSSRFHGGSRTIDWQEILRGLEDSRIELRMEFPGRGGESYVGNPDDYVDAVGYELVLRNLAENDGGVKKGAPPASKSAILGLQAVVFSGDRENHLCAICKEGASSGEKGRALPCSHVYHEECILPWLKSRNSCPVCRYELPTDDSEYEEQRKRVVSE